MKINHNIAALNAYRNLSTNNATTAKSLEKLSSGLRINRASDDAAGLAISEKMRSQIRGLDMAERNALDGVSFVQTAEGALSSVHTMLQRMRELSVQAANDSNTAVDRDAIQQEINQLTNEVNRISNATEFNTKKLLDGTLSNETTPITIGAAGKGSTLIGGMPVATTDLSTLSPNATLTITIDGTNYSLTSANLASATGTGKTTTDLISAINNKIGTAGKAENDGTGKIKITSATTGTSSNVTVDISSTAATPAAQIAEIKAVTTAFGFPDLADQGTGTNATITGTNVASPTTSLASISDDARLTITIKGIAYNLDKVALQNAAGGTMDDLLTAINNKIGVAGKAVDDGTGRIKITSSEAGTDVNPVSVTITGTTVTGIATTFGFTGSETPVAATGTGEQATIVGGTPSVTTDLGVISEDAKLTITIDGRNYHLSKTALTGATGTGKTTADLINAINTAIGTAGKAVNDGDKIRITSATEGVNSNVSIAITGETTTGISTAFGLSTLTAGVDAVPGIYQFQFSNKDITIDGETLPYFNATNPTGWTDAASLKAKIEANPTLSAKYNVGIVNGEIQLKQKAGQESPVAPQITNGKLLALQIGANQGQTVSLEIKNMQAAAIGISRTDNGGEQNLILTNGQKLKVWYTNSKQSNNGINNELTDYTVDVSTHEKASAAITVFNDAIERVSAERSRMGAVQNRLEQTVDNLKYMSENTTSAESRIRDVDMALEMTAYTKNNILVQSAQAMLAQANQLPQGVLQLLK